MEAKVTEATIGQRKTEAMTAVPQRLEDLRIVLIVTEEPFFLPQTVAGILDGPLGAAIRRIVLIPPTSSKRGWKAVAQEQMRFGLPLFLNRAFRFAAAKVWSRMPRPVLGKPWSVAQAIRGRGVPCDFFPLINTDEARAAVAREEPEILVSLSAGQIFGKKLLSLAKWTCLNIHNAPLPRYQGLMPSFWVLFHGERQTAVTVHRMVPEIDAGEIVMQVPVPIPAGETQEGLISRTKALAPQALKQAVQLYLDHQGNPPLEPFDTEAATYFGFPTRQDVAEFRRRGLKFR